MKINIDDNLRIVNESSGFAIEERKLVTPTKADKDGIIPPPFYVWKNAGYYGILEHAINGLLRYRLLRSDAESLTELKAQIETFKDEVSELFTVHVKEETVCQTEK